MKKSAKPASDEMRAEYDFSKGVRGKHATRYAEGTNAVLLAPDERVGSVSDTDVQRIEQNETKRTKGD